MVDHVNACQGYINQLSFMSLNFEDELLGLWFFGRLWLFGSLPHKFGTSVSNFALRGVVTYDLVKVSCLNEGVRRKSIIFSSSLKSDLLIAESMGEVMTMIRRIKKEKVSQREISSLW